LAANERQRLSFGYQYNAQEAILNLADTNAVELVGHVYLRDTTRSAQHTFYAEYGYQANDRLDLVLGLRGTLFPARGISYTEPRLNFNWYPWGKQQEGSWRVKGGIGRYWQFVFQILNFNDLGIGEPLWALASKDIPAQELWQYTLGIGKEKNDALLDVELYYKRNRNLTTANLLLEGSLGNNFFDGESKAAGLDVLWRKRWHKYSLWLSYSLSKVEFRFPELNLGLPYPARHDIRSRINCVNTYTLGKWEFSANLHLRSGIPYSPTPSIVEVACLTCQDGIERRLYFERLNTKRLRDFSRLDLSITWKWQKRRNHGKLGIAFYNFTNRKNILDKDYLLQSPPGGQQQPYSVQELSRYSARATPSFFVISQW
jgi:outer membrane receptor protein involved in Fe transport